MSEAFPIPKAVKGGLEDEGSVSSSPNWASNAPGSMGRTEIKGSWQGPGGRLERGNSLSLHRRVDSFDEEDYSSRFFQELQVSDPSDRAVAMGQLTTSLLDPEGPHADKLRRVHVRTLVRLANECPFDDVMYGCRQLLVRISREFEHIHIPKPSFAVSRFIPISMIPPINTTDSVVSRVFQDLFLQVGRVTHTNRLLALHPQHLRRYHQTFMKIMREPGPLPIAWRSYLAILAGSRYNCEYLASLQAHEFVASSGDPMWLQGVENAPKKIQNLLPLIAMMAHQPWLLTKDHIEPLVKGHDAWSISELVHAMLLISTYVSLAGFLFGCSVTPEVDLEETEDIEESDSDNENINNNSNTNNNNSFNNNGSSTYNNPHESVTETDPSCINNNNNNNNINNNTNNSNNKRERENRKGSASADTVKLMELLKKGIQEEESKDKAKDFANAGDESRQSSSLSLSVVSLSPHDLSRFRGAIEMRHTDFDVKSKNYSIFLVQEYGWKEHGYELLRRFYPDIADLLDEEFSQTYNMTYNTFSTSTHIDTLPFRRAIWYYVQRVKGMCHDDYNYQEVNLLLNRDVKFFVKKIACMPDSITIHDFEDLGLELRPEEKCHIALLAMESHKQACLLYGLHAVMQYMNRY